MRTDIIIVTYSKDKAWLEHCLASIQKFAAGFHKILVAVPDWEAGEFREMCDLHGAQLCGFPQVRDRRGHLHHCLMKCTANKLDPEADLFLYMDADCIFINPVTPADYMMDGKPVLLIESYASLERRKDPAVCWMHGTSHVLGFVPKYECMRRHPAVHHAQVLRSFKEWVEQRHGRSMESFALSQSQTFPVGFNDFNNLGAYAFRFHQEKYTIIDLTNNRGLRPKDKLLQFWSHGPIDKPQENWLDNQKRIVVPIEEIRKILT